jgi:ligand-binding SRPBCC domain-containing protein
VLAESQLDIQLRSACILLESNPKGVLTRTAIETQIERFATQQWIPFPVEAVFGFFADPLNLPLLMSPALKTRIEAVRREPPPAHPAIEDPAWSILRAVAGEGSEILISLRPVRWLPLRVPWLARISEFAWNSHFCDEQVLGPFKRFRHCHRIEAAARGGEAGTLVTDEIEYVLPLGALGRLGNFFVRRRLTRSFAERQKRLPEMLATAARKLTRQSARPAPTFSGSGALHGQSRFHPE